MKTKCESVETPSGESRLNFQSADWPFDRGHIAVDRTQMAGPSELDQENSSLCELKLMISNRSDNVAHLSCEFFSRFPTAVEWPCCHRKPSKSDFFNELKTPSSQHPSVAQIFHSWKRVVFQIPPDGLASERLSVGIETKFAQGRN
jgi:hypothetical protein